MDYKAVTRDWREFNPRDYLLEYYGDVGAENFALLRFAVKAFRAIPPDGLLLDFGGGPTIFPLIAAANRVREIHFSDYLDANLNEVRCWLNNEPSAFDWREFIRVTLGLEDQTNCTVQAVLEREASIRQRITRIFRCDANNARPIDEPRIYDILISSFCAESATDDWAQWRKFFRNIVSLLKPDGYLLLSALKGATCYTVGEKRFPAVSIRENDLTRTLIEEGFDPRSIILESIPADRPWRQYEGLMVAMAKKQGER
jgi:SAM-dependent methyltransferase